MSHITTQQFRVRDLELAAAACDSLDMELVRERTFKWYGSYVGDTDNRESVLAATGLTPEQYGTCDYVMRLRGANHLTYEVGLVKAVDGDGYVLCYDSWCGGYGLMDRIGENASKFIDRYVETAVLSTSQALGAREVTYERRPDGSVAYRMELPVTG